MKSLWIVVASAIALALPGGAVARPAGIAPDAVSLYSGEVVSPEEMARYFAREQRREALWESCSIAVRDRPADQTPSAAESESAACRQLRSFDSSVLIGALAGAVIGRSAGDGPARPTDGAAVGGMSRSIPGPYEPGAPTVAPPFIPWPPPRPSSRGDVPAATLFDGPADRTYKAMSVQGGGSRTGSVGATQSTPAPARSPATAAPRARTYGDLDRRLRVRLASRGYTSAGYFRTATGFAVVTQLERVDEDGVPIAGPQRWARQKDTARWALNDFARKFWRGEDGRYRMFLFVVEEEPFGRAGYPASQQDVDRWQDSGDVGLTARLRARPITDQTTLSVLIYEFAMSKGLVRELKPELDRPVPLQQHLASLGF